MRCNRDSRSKCIVRVRKTPISKWVLGNWRKSTSGGTFFSHETRTATAITRSAPRDPRVLFAGSIFSQQSWRSHKTRRKRTKSCFQFNLIIEFLFAFSIQLLNCVPKPVDIFFSYKSESATRLQFPLWALVVSRCPFYSEKQSVFCNILNNSLSWFSFCAFAKGKEGKMVNDEIIAVCFAQFERILSAETCRCYFVWWLWDSCAAIENNR